MRQQHSSTQLGDPHAHLFPQSIKKLKKKPPDQTLASYTVLNEVFFFNSVAVKSYFIYVQFYHLGFIAFK